MAFPWLAVATTAASLIGGSKSQPDYRIAEDPTINMNPRDMDPVLEDMLSAADRSADVNWTGQYEDLSDAYQRRGLGGSGIEMRNISEQARQQQLDEQALKRSYAIQLYQLWLARKQQERDWALAQTNQYNQQEQASAAGKQQFWNQLGQVGGYMLNKDSGPSGTVGGYNGTGMSVGQISQGAKVMGNLFNRPTSPTTVQRQSQKRSTPLVFGNMGNTVNRNY